MKKNTLLVLLALAVQFPLLAATEPNTLTEREKKAGWKLLFDGKSLTGWRSLKSETPGKGWTVEDGALTIREKKVGDLVTVDEFGDFELSVDWKITEAANSGIIYRVGLAENATYRTGPEYQIMDNVKGEDTKKQNHLAASLYDLVAPTKDVTKPVGEWNTAQIKVKGWHIVHWLNGVKVVDVDLASPEGKALLAASKFAKWPTFASLSRGHLALQEHGHVVSFRNLKVRELK